jgi:hypothetical protein
VDDLRVIIQFPTGKINLSLLQSAHTFSGTHPTSHSVGTGGYFAGDKGPEREADVSPPSGTSMELHHFAVCHMPL